MAAGASACDPTAQTSCQAAQADLRCRRLQGLFEARRLLYADPHAQAQDIVQRVQDSGSSICEAGVLQLQKVSCPGNSMLVWGSACCCHFPVIQRHVLKHVEVAPMYRCCRLPTHAPWRYFLLTLTVSLEM